ncbi:AzlC family ABC transporter permease [Oceaniglobus roseus]|uniref:AzlC family ABC transporter permease n=1 Tax=Oceaniglobus roseus TaxID=1737570 RepID=UPI000C7EA795|nr:AzlC family ABC transporter permease [Kandeliimicrobium roseum]
MAGSTVKSAYLRGLRDGAPFVLVVMPFSLLFGVVAMDAGLSLTEAMGFNVLVIAGASQFAAISQMNDNAPVLVVIATALAVNLRMAMYSAALVPHFGALPFWKRAVLAYLNVDQTYAASVLEFERRPEMSLDEKLGYFAGVATPIIPVWYTFAIVGALVGGAIPDAFALDFAMPITFLALIGPMLKSLAHVAAALTSIVAALALAFVPWGMGLLLAAACAMVVGAAVEGWMER